MLLPPAGEGRVPRVGSAHSGWPDDRASRCQNFSFAQPTMIQPSLVWNAWNGTSDGCAEWRVRDRLEVGVQAQVAG